jgi:Sec-independent protein translocase protein TatA
LDNGKVDKAHYKPALENLKDKYAALEKKIDEAENELEDEIRKLKEELGDDITGVHAVANQADEKASTHVCHRDERIETVEKTVTFWGTWFLRGLVGMILLLITAGGGWVYSHVRLEETAKRSSESVDEFKKEMGKVKSEQQELKQVLTRMETANTPQETFREVLEDVLKKQKESL